MAERRASRHERGYTNRWARTAKGFLARHRWCRMCAAMGVQTPATEVDHIKRHQGDKRLFWDRNNWQPLCKSHHSSKTRSEVNGREMVLKGVDVDGMPLDPSHHWNAAK